MRNIYLLSPIILTESPFQCNLLFRSIYRHAGHQPQKEVLKYIAKSWPKKATEATDL